MHSICYGRKRRRLFAVYPLNSVVMLSYLAGSDQKLMVSYTLHSILYIHLPPTEIRRQDVILQYAADRSDTQKTVCCRVPHFIIIYLWRSIGKAFSWYYITAFSEPEILHKYWKGTEGCSNTNCCISYYRQITFSQSHRYCTLLCNTMRPSPILYS